jgi:hypothetical protein
MSSFLKKIKDIVFFDIFAHPLKRNKKNNKFKNRIKLKN